MKEQEITQMLAENGRLKAKVQNRVKDSLDLASKFAYDADRMLFIYLFGEASGAHLWAEFQKFHRNLLWFWGVLSPKYRDIIGMYIEETYGGHYGT